MADNRVIMGCITTLLLMFGVFNLQVTASVRDQSSGSVNSDSNSIASGSSHHKSASNGNVLVATTAYRKGPHFDRAASKNVTAMLGKTAFLNCRVKNLGNRTNTLQVSWIRHRDVHLLTVGRYTYTSDQRFRAIHQPHSEDWMLQIKFIQHRDSGIYECQISSTPHLSHFIHLSVVEPSAEIIGSKDVYIDRGSTINLTCIIHNSPEPPAYIFWNHNNTLITYDESPRGGVTVLMTKGEVTTSTLLIEKAIPTDSGLYQCNPANSPPQTVTVHVLNVPSSYVIGEIKGEQPEASHRSLAILKQPTLVLALINLFFCIL